MLTLEKKAIWSAVRFWFGIFEFHFHSQFICYIWLTFPWHVKHGRQKVDHKQGPILIFLKVSSNIGYFLLLHKNNDSTPRFDVDVRFTIYYKMLKKDVGTAHMKIESSQNK